MATKVRQRRQPFDREAGIATAQALFHERSYDAVSMVDLMEAIDIKPPSFYAAYGSKAELFDRAMRRYAEENELPINEILAEGRPPAEALTALLVSGARQYGKHPTQRGCLVTEGLRANDPKARQLATDIASQAAIAIRRYAKSVSPRDADAITDYVLVTMRGLSAAACLGMSKAKLVKVAENAGRYFEHLFA